jgi:hypothetical protein
MSGYGVAMRKSEKVNTKRPASNVCGVCAEPVDSGKLLCQLCAEEVFFAYDKRGGSQ